jgi:hypothetical protein
MEKNKRPKRRLKIGYIFAFVIIIAFILLVLKLVLPSSGINKYGDRLDGIEKHPFTEKEKNKVIKNIKEKEQVVSCKIDVQGKIINVIFTVNKDVSKDDSKNIATGSLADFSDKVKSFYDIQFMIKKKDEEGTKVTKQVDDETTKEVTVYEFPIMGYKNKSREGITW